MQKKTLENNLHINYWLIILQSLVNPVCYCTIFSIFKALCAHHREEGVCKCSTIRSSTTQDYKCKIAALSTPY